MAVNCEACGASVEKRAAEVNRARKVGYGLYCNRACAGLARRVGRTKAQAVAEKREYDRQYRAKNRALLKAKKAAWYQETRDPVKEAAIRRANMPRHVAYCRQPQYRQKKHQYDAERYAEQFGEWADAHRVLMALRRAVIRAEPDPYERRKARGYYLNLPLRKVRHGTA